MVGCFRCELVLDDFYRLDDSVYAGLLQNTYCERSAWRLRVSPKVADSVPELVARCSHLESEYRADGDNGLLARLEFVT